MNRLIEFRGQVIDTKDWVYGYYFTYIDTEKSDTYIGNPTFDVEPNLVIPETVGQYTGLRDSKGIKIFEGDIVCVPCNDFIKEGNHVVYFYKDSFVTSSVLFTNKETANKNSLSWTIERGAEVIGNIHSNPELIK